MLETGGFREVVRSVSTSYPIPLAMAMCLAFATGTLAGAIVADGALRWVLVGFAAVTTGFGLVLFAWAAVSRPELLRSEWLEMAHRMLDAIGDSENKLQVINEAGRLVAGEASVKRHDLGRGGLRDDT